MDKSSAPKLERWRSGARCEGEGRRHAVGPDEQARQVFNLRNLATRHKDKGLAWSVLEGLGRSAMQILKQEGTGADRSMAEVAPR